MVASCPPVSERPEGSRPLIGSPCAYRYLCKLRGSLRRPKNGSRRLNLRARQKHRRILGRRSAQSCKDLRGEIGNSRPVDFGSRTQYIGFPMRTPRARFAPPRDPRHFGRREQADAQPNLAGGCARRGYSIVKDQSAAQFAPRASILPRSTRSTRGQYEPFLSWAARTAPQSAE